MEKGRAEKGKREGRARWREFDVSGVEGVEVEVRGIGVGARRGSGWDGGVSAVRKSQLRESESAGMERRSEAVEERRIEAVQERRRDEVGRADGLGEGEDLPDVETWEVPLILSL